MYNTRNIMSSIFFMLNNFFAGQKNETPENSDLDFDDLSESDDDKKQENDSEQVYEDDVVLHNANGPAIYKDEGNEQEWWYDGKRHRENGPALIRKGYRSGNKNVSFDEEEWWVKGELHREDGPARTIKHPFGIYSRMEWWINGKLHREEEPAVIEKKTEYLESARYENKTEKILIQEWWVNGKRHNPNGPSVQETKSSVRTEWWDNGEKDVRRGNFNSYSSIRSKYNTEVNNSLKEKVMENLF